MAYTKTIWVNDDVPDINASNLNNIENGIADASTNIAEVSANVEALMDEADVLGVFTEAMFAPKGIGEYTPVATKKYVADFLMYLPDSVNTFQGLTFYDGYFYCSFDMGSGNGKIAKYTPSGLLVSQTGSIAIGHAAEIDYRVADSLIWVTNGGGATPCMVYKVNFGAGTISATIDLSTYGNSALLAIDNVHDYVILHTTLTGGDAGAPTFTIFNAATMAVINTFTLGASVGTPQGLTCDGKNIYYYTNNLITVYNLDGTLKFNYPVTKTGESEGLCIASANGGNFLVMGYNTPNRLYKITDNEAEKYDTVKLLNCPNIKTTAAGSDYLLPRIFGFVLRVPDAGGNVVLAPWTNIMGDQNNVSSLSQTTTAITVVLKLGFTSVIYFDCADSTYLRALGYTANCDIAADGKTITIRVYNNTGTIVNPSSLPNAANIRCLIIGGVSVSA